MTILQKSLKVFL